MTKRRMTKGMTEAQKHRNSKFFDSSFSHSCFFRHSCFVIRHSQSLQTGRSGMISVDTPSLKIT